MSAGDDGNERAEETWLVRARVVSMVRSASKDKFEVWDVGGKEDREVGVGAGSGREMEGSGTFANRREDIFLLPSCPCVR